MSRPAFVEVEGRRIRVDGDPHKPPVPLVHGFGFFD